MIQPPPLPPEHSRETFYHWAGAASICVPVLAMIALCWFLFANAGDAAHRTSMVIPAALAFIATIGGFGLGVLALCGIPQHGRRGLLTRGIIGIGLNGLLVAAALALVLSAYGRKVQQRREAWSDIESASRELRTELRTNYSSEAGFTNDVTAQMGKFRSALESASQNVQGDDALVMQAMAAFAAQSQKDLGAFAAVTDELTRAEVVNMSTLTNRSQIEERRQLVQKFIAANKTLKESLLHQDKVVEAELQARNLPPFKVKKFLEGFRASQTPLLPKVAGIRACDDQMGRALIEILDLAEAQWGKWQYDEETQITLFEDGQAADEFNAQLEVIEAASRKQIQLQGEIIALQQRAAATRAGSTR